MSSRTVCNEWKSPSLLNSGPVPSTRYHILPWLISLSLPLPSVAHIDLFSISWISYFLSFFFFFSVHAHGEFDVNSLNKITFRFSQSNLWFFSVFYLFRAALTAHVAPQARGQIGAVAAGLCHSHSNTRSKLCLRPTPQLTAMPDLQPTRQGQGSNPHPHGY